MADSIVQGLFGPTAQQIQQERAATGYSQDLQAVRLDPRQQANLALRQGGRAFGSQVMAPLLGVQDPELQKAQMAQQLAAQFQTTTPEGLTQYAQALAQNGAPDLAQMAMARVQDMQTKAQTMQINAAGVDLKHAQAVKALREPNPGIAALIGKSTPESVAAYQLSGNPADLVLADKGLTGTALEKVSAAEQNIENLSTGNAEIDSWIKKVDPANPKVTFGPGSSIAAGVSNVAGKPTDNALAQAQLRRFVAREANAILVAAKGTQTEGDAQRAYDMIMSGLDKNSNEGVQGALSDLKTMKENTVKGLTTYVDSMKTKGKGTSSSKPSAPAQTSSQTIAAIRAANPGLENYTDQQILEAAKRQKQSK